MTPEEKLASLGLTLPEAPVPVAMYVPYRWAGNLLYLSGQGPKRPDGTYRPGRLGRLLGLGQFPLETLALGDLPGKDQGAFRFKA